MDKHFASNVAPYAPPPDQVPQSSTTNTRPSWFQRPQQAYSSYQSGGIPTFGDNQAGITGFGGGGGDPEQGVHNMWETRLGMRVDVEAALAYLLGPVSALVLLILETTNDYVRFHAYQSALLTTPLLLIRLLALLIGFWSFLQTLLTLALVGCSVGMAFQAYRDANSGGLARFRLPYIGELADRWVGDE
ncbi:SubName: Full=Uncharacterized protein {ECO:0000313/EMBL:CCA69110.1} [Serendipita indica DSM 11827]|uniref:Uncharacterized protein n=1 Tax=Serendipita indica (strain DSM 11827) TaxID=1109443 RepID=G4TCT4_SERID|nr:SubName: Full=Uncharacterized protein {ECO:0000313/EMBL:CCA69110.1} [Serendipita indica DSM 11827]CCA69110.1 hypothetical protein PIIN_03010 [Serendipita indica DSM 11827]